MVETSTIRVSTRTPPAWMNAGMRLMLRTPLLERWIGKQVALLSFTGRRSGTPYTIPVSYDRTGDTVLMITKLFRNWWRNFIDGADVKVRLAGRDLAGRASAAIGTEADVEDLYRFLAERPFDAKAYGLRPGPDGALLRSDVAQLVDQLVFVRVALTT